MKIRSVTFNLYAADKEKGKQQPVGSPLYSTKDLRLIAVNCGMRETSKHEMCSGVSFFVCKGCLCSTRAIVCRKLYQITKEGDLR